MGYALKICKSVAGPDSGAGSRLPAAELQPAGRPVLHPPQSAQAPLPQYDQLDLLLIIIKLCRVQGTCSAA